jgi:hypothetical protein
VSRKVCHHPLILKSSISVIDNFGKINKRPVTLRLTVFTAHLGGFLMGLLVGTTFYPVISTTRRHRLIVWTFRLVAIPLAVVLFIVLIRNFYTSDPYAGACSFTVNASTLLLKQRSPSACSGCRYLSCFPTKANDYCKGWVRPHHVCEAEAHGRFLIQNWYSFFEPYRKGHVHSNRWSSFLQGWSPLPLLRAETLHLVCDWTLSYSIRADMLPY